MEYMYNILSYHRIPMIPTKVSVSMHIHDDKAFSSYAPFTYVIRRVLSGAHR